MLWCQNEILKDKILNKLNLKINRIMCEEVKDRQLNKLLATQAELIKNLEEKIEAQ